MCVNDTQLYDVRYAVESVVEKFVEECAACDSHHDGNEGASRD